MNEDKQAICDALLYTLQLTREHHDLVELVYQKRVNDQYYDELVTAVWGGDARAQKTINVTADSGIAMIRDILRYI